MSMSGNLVFLARMAAIVFPITALAQDLITVSDPGGSGFDQSYSHLVTTADGALCGFSDRRSGHIEHRVRPLDQDGKPLGDSRLIVVTKPPSVIVAQFLIASNRSGDAFAAWRLSGVKGVFVARIDPSTGGILEETLILDDEGGTSRPSQVDLEVREDGTTLFIFMLDGTLRARLYSRDLDPLGPSFIIEDNTGGNYVDTAMHEDGSFTLAWTGVTEPYFSVVRTRRHGPDGQPTGPVRQLTDEAVGVFIDTPAIAGRPDGSAMVAWMRNESTPMVIGQLLDDTGLPVGAPVPILEPEQVLGDPLGLYARDDGAWVLVQGSNWGDRQIDIQRFEPDMGEPNALTVIGDAMMPASTWMPDSQEVLLAWSGSINDSDTDVLGSMVSTDSPGKDEILLLSDDADGADQSQPVVAGSATGASVLAWHDRRNDRSDVYIQMLDENGSSIGGNVLVGNLADGQGDLIDVDINGSGDCVVAWCEPDGDGSRYVYARHDRHGRLVGGINHVGPAPDYSGAISILEDGRVLVSWDRFVSFGEGSLAIIEVRHRLFDGDDVPLTSDPRTTNLVIDDHQCRLLDVIETDDGTPRVFYTTRRREAGHQSGLHSMIQSRSIDMSGEATGLDFVHDDRPGYCLHSSVGSGRQGLMMATIHVDSPDLIDVRRFSEELDVEHESSISSLADPDSLSVLVNIDGSMIVSARGILEMGDPTEGVESFFGFEFPRLDSGVARTLQFLNSDDMLRMTGTFGADMAGSRALHVASGPSGTDQGQDILMGSLEVTPCPTGDFNCDFRVDGMDLSRILGFWGQSETDLDGDGTTDGADLSILLGNWTG